MRLIRASFVLGVAASLPAQGQSVTLQGTGIEATFVITADDVQLTAIKRPNQSFAFTNSAPAARGAGCTGDAAGLWEIEYFDNSDPNVPVTMRTKVLQSGAAPGLVWAATPASQPTTLYAVWTDVPVPLAGQAGGATIDVGMQVSIVGGDELAFTMAVDRKVPGVYSIDRVRGPILDLEGPVTPVAGETGLEAQVRARLFVPSHGANAFPSVNLPLYLLLSDPSFAKRAVHPHYQAFPFFAVANMGIGDPGYRQMLYAQAVDPTAHWKEFDYRHASCATGDPVASLSHIWVPTHTDELANDPTPNENGNTFESPYPFVVKILDVTSDDFWWTALTEYRDYVKTSVLPILEIDDQPGVPSFESNPRISDYRNASVSLANYSTDGVALPVAHVGRARDLMLAYLNRMMPACVANEGAHPYMYLANYRVDGLEHTPYGPGPGYVYPNLFAIVDDIQQGRRNSAVPNVAPIRVFAYTEGLATATNSLWLPPDDSKRYDRFGVKVGTSGQPNEVHHTDFGQPSGQTWFTSNASPSTVGVGYDVFHTGGFKGLYIDGVSGQGFKNGYPHPNGALMHTPHGGDYSSVGKREFFDNARSMMIAKWGGGTGDPAQTVLWSEVGEESAVGLLDGCNQGYNYLPHHMEFLALEGGFNPVSLAQIPARARAQWIPIWNAVYHEYQPATTPGIPLSTLAIEGGPKYPVQVLVGDTLVTVQGPNGPLAGVTLDEWVDAVAFVHASLMSNGSRPLMFPYDHSKDHSAIEYSTAAPGYTYAAPLTTAAGDEAFDFLFELQLTMQYAFAGRFLLFGQMEHPLIRDPLTVGAEANPTHPLWERTELDDQDTVLPWLELISPTVSWTEAAHFTTQPVRRVLDGVWRHNGDLRIVLVNWSRNAETIAADFAPALYGITGGFTITELERSTECLFAPSTDPNKTWTSASANVLGIDPTVPARSVRVLQVTTP